MIDISGHLNNIRRDVGFLDLRKEIVVNCCGYQFFNKYDFSKYRPLGRLDYQLIYIYKGYGDFLLNDENIRLKQGEVIFYRPHEIQKYKYYAHSNTQAYWIHFTGSKIEELLDNYKVIESHVNIGKHKDVIDLFMSITAELQLKQHNFNEIILLKFRLLLSLLNRYKTQEDLLIKQKHNFNELILTLNDSYSEQWTTERMANFCKLSESRFLHLFKEQIGVSPKQFLNQLRIDKAKEIMINNDTKIQDIAAIVGFSDPLYFSKFFKKREGVNPSEYIKLNN